MRIESVNIIGTGNVADFIASALKGRVAIQTIYGRNLEAASQLASKVGGMPISDLSELLTADLTIVAVSDDAISNVVRQINESQFVVHTSGSVSIDVLSKYSIYGILYPLQTISKTRKVNASEVPFLVEASSPETESSISGFCERNLSQNVVVANSDKRAIIHLAAVLVNNFANHLFTEAELILNSIDQDLSILHPLMKETISKAVDLGPIKAQTGPAKRNDKAIMGGQLEKLDDQQLKQLYVLMSELIAKRHSNS